MMMPGPLAVGVYTAVKLAGYAAFAAGLNRVAQRNVRIFRFGLAKTLLGLAGGVLYLVIVETADLNLDTDWQLWVGAIPVRLLVWTSVIAWFYGFRERAALFIAAVFAGVAWSYALDGLMSFFYQWLPGMDMPIC